MPSPGEHFVDLLRLGKRYGETRALADLTLHIRQGEFLTLLGPSGSGKSTTLMLLAGFEQPSEGHIERDGRDITGLPADQRDFGVVFQGYALFPHMSVEQNIAFPLRVRKLPAAQIGERVGRMLERVGLAGMGKRQIQQLSGGQQQRVALARALVFEPPLLLLDEPLSALDRRLRQEMQGELARMHKEFGTTFVFVTHDQEEALALSDRIAVFNHGRLEQLGAPQEVYERPASRFVANFLGDTNLLGVQIVARHDGVLVCEYQGQRLMVDEPGAIQPLGGACWLAIRPEHVDLQPVSQAGTGNGLVARMERTTYLGTHVGLEMRLHDGEPLALRLPLGHPLLATLETGASYWCAWATPHAHLILA
ncbi:ABC transporter ATP-binding protein [Phytopseudomonas dryadis]|uniref:Spermidine/putrescine import ATP-binding protein PotA n=1 Tax=Phytopseudomonas dryadis TaxID=2487520 RepID=A0A4Q9QTL6_9GAMM|nr:MULTISPECIES: ABC transporter ATP-binding protein [Pseudomonas]TBU86243.1 spermidine/putrescine ABC transporter [Pseudomonas dryadis]TBV07679.1 spermidine/putrescine ABC transporter [Pseudomonas dryadis]TBV19893.1 spermidine/putrescine ABC transporter [Pseudomonas sp. FRB 230]